MLAASSRSLPRVSINSETTQAIVFALLFYVLAMSFIWFRCVKERSEEKVSFVPDPHERETIMLLPRAPSYVHVPEDIESQARPEQAVY